MPTKTLTITGMHPITSGVGNYGPWTLYAVDANGEDGVPIQDTLKTFQELPVGQPIEVEVERKDDPQYGTEFMLKKPKGARYALRPSPVDDAYEDLKKRVYEIEKHLGLVGARASDVPAPPPAAPVTVPPTDDDIPF